MYLLLYYYAHYKACTKIEIKKDEIKINFEQIFKNLFY